MAKQLMIMCIALTTLKVGDKYHYADSDSALCELPEDEFKRQLALGNVREVTGDEVAAAPREAAATDNAADDSASAGGENPAGGGKRGKAAKADAQAAAQADGDGQQAG